MLLFLLLQEFGNLRGDRRLNETQIFAEVIANVMADWKIVGAGVFFDRYKFRMSPPVNNTDPRFVSGITREFFGPYSWRIKASGVGSVGGADYFRAMDMAGLWRFMTMPLPFANRNDENSYKFIRNHKCEEHKPTYCLSTDIDFKIDFLPIYIEIKDMRSI